MILCFHILEDRRRDSEIERELYRARLEELDNAIAELLETRPTTSTDTSLRRTESERDPSSTTSMYSAVVENTIVTEQNMTYIIKVVFSLNGGDNWFGVKL